MRRFMPIPALITLQIAVLSACSSSPTKQNGEWLAKSNAVAEEYLTARAVLVPEEASRVGFRQFDSKALKVTDDFDTREELFYEDWAKRVAKLRDYAPANERGFETDLEILSDHIDRKREAIQVGREAKVIPFWESTKLVFQSLRELVNPQSDAARKAAAIERFHAYVRGAPPLLPASESNTKSKIARYGAGAFWPLKQELEQFLEDSPSYVKGVKELLKSAGPESAWAADFAAFEKQASAYDSFVRKTLVPRARVDHRLPKAVYANLLRDRGIDISPARLSQMARQDYAGTLAQYKALAARVASEHGWSDASPAAVIRHLKEKQVTEPAQAEKMYKNAARALDEIIQKHDLVELPDSSLRIRTAGDAESRSAPVPHLTQPPLVENHGERPEFVAPSSTSGKLPFDDFSYEPASYILTAHEGRPGHDLQYSTMLDRGTSLIRSEYAFNNVNVEGWALYAEKLVYDFIPKEAQLVGLQMRLLRMARAFLDPGLQSGEISTAQAKKTLTDEVGISEPFAALELKRYLFQDPGQAPSYYYGLKLMEKARAATEARLGSSFRDRCFNDQVLSYGLLPLQTLPGRLATDLDCAHFSDAASGF